jgi:3-oxoacyl-[acyl-carrier-protein] synthase-3
MAGILSVGWYIPDGRRDSAMIARDYGVARAAVDAFGLRGHAVAEDDDHPSTMGAKAVREALRAARLDLKDIGLLIFAGMTRDYPAPWVGAFGVLHELGAKHAAGFDLSNRCASVHDALWTARALVHAGGFDNVVVCSADRFDYLIGPPRPIGQVSDVAFSAGAAAAVVSRAATNEMVAFSFRTNDDLSLHNQLCPRAGASRVPLNEAAIEADLHRWQNTMKVGQAARLSQYLMEADKHNIQSVCRSAGFDDIDFLACAPLDLKAQVASLAGVGLGPEKTLFTLPQLGHMGPADSLVALGLAAATGRSLGRRVVMSTRSAVYSNALAIRALGDAVIIASGGLGLDVDAWRESERERLAALATPTSIAASA